MVVSSDPTWLQGAFNSLVAIFDKVGLLTNVGKTVSMVCHPCQAGSGNRTEEAYGRRVTGMGRSYTDRQREKVECGECGEVLAVKSMSSYLMTRHGKAAARRQRWTPPSGWGDQDIQDVIPGKGGTEAVSGNRVPGVFSDTDGDAGALHALART